MNSNQPPVIYTIGHSTQMLSDFIGMLKSFEIQVLADIRHYPGSRKYPHFNKENLKKELPENGIEYLHLEALGGRRKTVQNSKNTRWRNASFRGYADYMETDGFKEGIAELQALSSIKTTAYMCSEAVWWRCHRSIVSDWLKAKGWKVLHITANDKATEHPYTSAARVVDNQVYYFDENLFHP